MSEECAQLKSLLFCLAIQSIDVKLSSEFNVWYIDDGTIDGNQAVILHEIHLCNLSIRRNDRSDIERSET